jgi:hypothetical protein
VGPKYVASSLFPSSQRWIDRSRGEGSELKVDASVVGNRVAEAAAGVVIAAATTVYAEGDIFFANTRLFAGGSADLCNGGGGLRPGRERSERGRDDDDDDAVSRIFRRTYDDGGAMA